MLKPPRPALLRGALRLGATPSYTAAAFFWALSSFLFRTSAREREREDKTWAMVMPVNVNTVAMIPRATESLSTESPPAGVAEEEEGGGGVFGFIFIYGNWLLGC